jgi:2,4-dienoyl-CoA reductase-like NADH-dependent reductase (Old Yellow Enzyme family)
MNQQSRIRQNRKVLADMMDQPLTLPCGETLKNRLAKAAMSDELGDGAGGATPEQAALYRRWAQGGAGLVIVGECQVAPDHPENCGNLLLNPLRSAASIRRMTEAGRVNGMHLWAQLGQAGCLAAPVTGAVKGPSALTVGAVHTKAMEPAEIEALPHRIAESAVAAKSVGFTGVEVHAAHGFLLNQFLSPFFNRRTDRWGGSVRNRARLLLEAVDHVREAVGPRFPVSVRLNVQDGLVGGLTLEEGVAVAALLNEAPIDLLNLSGGVYFPGAPSASDRVTAGPYFLEAARAVRKVFQGPLMTAGGFKTRNEALAALESGSIDVVGLARLLVLDPDLPNAWLAGNDPAPAFPRFADPPEGGITAWFTRRIWAIGSEEPLDHGLDPKAALTEISTRREDNRKRWKKLVIDSP